MKNVRIKKNNSKPLAFYGKHMAKSNFFDKDEKQGKINATLFQYFSCFATNNLTNNAQILAYN